MTARHYCRVTSALRKAAKETQPKRKAGACQHQWTYPSALLRICTVCYARQLDATGAGKWRMSATPAPDARGSHDVRCGCDRCLARLVLDSPKPMSAAQIKAAAKILIFIRHAQEMGCGQLGTIRRESVGAESFLEEMLGPDNLKRVYKNKAWEESEL